MGHSLTTNHFPIFPLYTWWGVTCWTVWDYGIIDHFIFSPIAIPLSLYSTMLLGDFSVLVFFDICHLMCMFPIGWFRDCSQVPSPFYGKWGWAKWVTNVSTPALRQHFISFVLFLPIFVCHYLRLHFFLFLALITWFEITLVLSRSDGRKPRRYRYFLISSITLVE